VTRSARPVFLALLLLGPLLAGCGDDPFQLQWTENPGTATLYSLDREELNRPSAFNMAMRARVIPEGAHAEGRWDFALDRQDGQLFLLPPRVLGVVSRAGLVPVPGTDYQEVREAPADTAQYVTGAPVPLQTGTVYIVRTHQQPGQWGQACHFYGRLEPLEIDVEAGVLTFRHDTSPDCNNRRLVPPGS
jgi:hypothetical protein